MTMVRGLSIAVLVLSVVGLAMGVVGSDKPAESAQVASARGATIASAITLGSALIALAISDKNRSN